MFWKNLIKYRYAIWFYILLFCYVNFAIFKLYGFSIFPDEYSYWAYAAKIAGHDWSEVTELGSFYAWGYSLILVPIFYICHNSLLAYRAAIVLNFVMLGLAYIIQTKILKDFGFENNENNQIYAAIAMMYPPVVFYAHTTMAETLLMLGYFFLIALLIRYIKKPTLIALISLYVAAAYMYLVHMRVIGILAALFFSLVYAEIKYYKNFKRAVGILILSVVGMLAIHIAKEQIAPLFYRNQATELYAVNTLKGQIDKIRYIFSFKGFVAFLCEVCGGFLYLGVSGFGITYWGLYCLVKKCRPGSCAGVNALWERVACAFVFMASLSQIAISAVYNVIPDSYDSITYGRYQDYITPVLIAVGLGEIMHNVRRIGRYLFADVLLMVLLTIVVTVYSSGLELNPMKGYFMTGMSSYAVGEFDPRSFYAIVCLFSVLCTLLYGALIVIQSRLGLRWIFAVGAAMQLMFSVRLGKLYLYPFNDLARQDIQIAQRIENLINDSDTKRRVIYMDYNEIPAVGLLQFMLRDIEIEVYRAEEWEPQKYHEDKAIVLLGANEPLQQKLEKDYEREVARGHFLLLYNE